MATQYSAPSILRTILRTLRNEETKARRLRTLLRSTVRESIYLSKYRLMNQMAIRSLVRKRSGFFSSTSLHRAREGGTGDDAVAALVGIWGLGGPSFLPSFLPSGQGAPVWEKEGRGEASGMARLPLKERPCHGQGLPASDCGLFRWRCPAGQRGCWLSLSALNSQSCRAAFLYEAGSGSGVVPLVESLHPGPYEAGLDDDYDSFQHRPSSWPV